MKKHLKTFGAISLLAVSQAGAQSPTYTNFIRQTQYPSEVQWDATVAASGSQLSALAIDPGGARFDLWTVNSSPVTNYLLSSVYVGTYIPVANVVVRSEDPYDVIPRTRADRPFYVDITVSGLLNGETDPEPSKSVKLLRHVQSYGVKGSGINLDRTQATLLSQAYVTTNGTQRLTYALSSVPGADRSKLRGEERFSIYSLEDYQAPESQISSQFIQIWPVTDGSISGIASGQLIRGATPQVTFTYNDIYPSATIYAQIYKGNQVLGKSGTVVPGSVKVFNESIPQDITLPGNNLDLLIDTDGRWTLEMLISTPFGLDRLAWVSFDIDRTINMNGTFTTIEN